MYLRYIRNKFFDRMGLSKTEKKILLKKKRRFLCNFSKLNRKEQLSKLKTLSNEEIHTICECFYNLLEGTLPLDGKRKRKIKKMLDPIKNETRKLTHSNINISKKRKLLSSPQVGGGIITGLSTLMGIILPTILSSIRK